MEWSTLMETALTRWGESALLVAIGACTGLLFGLGAQRSRLCTRAAVLECCEGRPGMRLAIWALALGGVMAGAQLLVAAGALQPLKSRFMDATGSVSGALLGGLIVGVCENLAAAYISPAYKDAVALIIFMVVILFKPQGLLGKKEERKV